jgi:hypothetical protein
MDKQALVDGYTKLRDVWELGPLTWDPMEHHLGTVVATVVGTLWGTAEAFVMYGHGRCACDACWAKAVAWDDLVSLLDDENYDAVLVHLAVAGVPQPQYVVQGL